MRIQSRASANHMRSTTPLACRGHRRVGSSVVAQLVEHVDHQWMDEVLLVAAVDAPEARRRGVDIAVRRRRRAGAGLDPGPHQRPLVERALAGELVLRVPFDPAERVIAVLGVGADQRRHVLRNGGISRVAGEVDIAGRARRAVGGEAGRGPLAAAAAHLGADCWPPSRRLLLQTSSPGSSRRRRQAGLRLRLETAPAVHRGAGERRPEAEQSIGNQLTVTGSASGSGSAGCRPSPSCRRWICRRRPASC